MSSIVYMLLHILI